MGCLLILAGVKLKARLWLALVLLGEIDVAK